MFLDVPSFYSYKKTGPNRIELIPDSGYNP
jgi:hypothetical protein